MAQRFASYIALWAVLGIILGMILNRNKIITIGIAVIVIVLGAYLFSRSNLESGMPDFERRIVFPEHIPDSVRVELKTNIETAVSNIKNNPDDFNSWYDLGLYYKAINDIEGARLMWEYGAKIRPDAYLPRLALADLYGFYIRDEGKAKFYFNDAIEKDPKQIGIYFQATTYYRDVLKDVSGALRVVKKGLEENPNDPDLLALKQSLEQPQE